MLRLKEREQTLANQQGRERVDGLRQRAVGPLTLNQFFELRLNEQAALANQIDEFGDRGGCRHRAFPELRPVERTPLKSVEYPSYLEYSVRSGRNPQAKGSNFDGNSDRTG